MSTVSKLCHSLTLVFVSQQVMCVQLRMQCDEQLLNMADSLVKIVTPSIAVSGAGDQG